MNLPKAWDAKLGAGSFLPSINLYRKCDMFVCFPLDSIMECKDGCKQYQFTSFAKHTIESTFKDFIRKEEPAILILATCYSEKSDVNKLLWEYGHYAALNISADRGQLTDGRIYELDGDQRKVLEKVQEDHLIYTYHLLLLVIVNISI